MNKETETIANKNKQLDDVLRKMLSTPPQNSKSKKKTKKSDK